MHSQTSKSLKLLEGNNLRENKKFAIINFMYNKTDKNSIKQLFDNISANYDLLNTLMSLGFQGFIKRLAVSHLPDLKKPKIIDLCTGTGDIAINLSKKYSDSEIIACDFSEKMLEIAENKTKNAKNISLIQADAMNLPFENNTFDVCFISFGLRNLPDIDAALLEIKRVLKDGGTVSILDLGRVRGVLSPIYNIYFSKIIPLLGNLVHKHKLPYQYLVDSLQTYPTQDEMLKKLANIGFSNEKNYDFLFGALAQQIAHK